MFASFSVFCQFNNVLQLWDKYKDAMVEDLIPKYDYKATGLAYEDIEQIGKHLADFQKSIMFIF